MEDSAQKSPEPGYDAFRQRFRRNANSLAARYGAHVLLVGGALEDEGPRDYDVRIVLPDTEFRRLYGAMPYKSRPASALFDFEPWEWLRAYDSLKQSRLMSERMSVPVDLQIQAASETRAYEGKPAVQLDTAPEWVLSAGRPREMAVP